MVFDVLIVPKARPAQKPLSKKRPSSNAKGLARLGIAKPSTAAPATLATTQFIRPLADRPRIIRTHSHSSLATTATSSNSSSLFGSSAASESSPCRESPTGLSDVHENVVLSQTLA